MEPLQVVNQSASYYRARYYDPSSEWQPYSN